MQCRNQSSNKKPDDPPVHWPGNISLNRNSNMLSRISIASPNYLFNPNIKMTAQSAYLKYSIFNLQSSIYTAERSDLHN